MPFLRHITYPNGFSHEVMAGHLDGFDQLALRIANAEAYLNKEDALALAEYIQKSFA